VLGDIGFTGVTHWSLSRTAANDLPSPLIMSEDPSSPPATTSTPVTTASPPDVPPSEPQVSLTFLLVSGRRRTMSYEPATTIRRVQEMLWNTWPTDWTDERPPTPSYLRILYLGKVLQDEETLISLKLPLTPAGPTIVHLSIRQQPLSTEDDLNKKKKRRRDNVSNNATSDPSQSSAGCCGCIIC
jgi:hypothetical protein